MYPYELFLGIDLYSLFIVVGVIGCFVLIRIMQDRMNFEAKFQNFVILTTLVTVLGGYGTAVVAQAFYNIKKEGKFVLNSGTGATFYGGLADGK